MSEKLSALEAHRAWKGKLEIKPRCNVSTRAELALAYTPGVADACLEIKADPKEAYELTRKWNSVAVISDGSAVLGLGNIGALASMPVMEGKCALFKVFGGVDAVPLVLGTQDTEAIISVIKAVAPTYGGINLEDISAPRCFEIERRLIEELDIPVFHDDQHGTAIVVLAGLINAFKVVNKPLKSARIVINGPGAAGCAIAKLLQSYGVGEIILCDQHGTLVNGRENMDWSKQELASLTNPRGVTGGLEAALSGADAFIGVSVANALKPEYIRFMAERPVVFAMANPVPEILPDEAKAAGAAVAATGRSDYPNQINNLLAFPGIFRGVLDSGARRITVDMKLAAAQAIADIEPEGGLSAESIIPTALDARVPKAVAKAVYLCKAREGRDGK